MIYDLESVSPSSLVEMNTKSELIRTIGSIGEKG
jgi:hypothetical protein